MMTVSQQAVSDGPGSGGELTSEPYETLKFQFVDSAAYQKDSLDNLSSRLAKSDHEFKILHDSELIRDWRGVEQEELMSLAKHKGYFPYEHISSIAVLDGGKPTREDFANSLGVGSLMTEDEYRDFELCWTSLQRHKYGGEMTLRDYTAFYNALVCYIQGTYVYL
jgi:hypothetical protein